MVLEYVNNLFAFAFAHKAMVYMYADQLLANCLDKQGGNNGAANTAGKCQQTFLLPICSRIAAICSSINTWASSVVVMRTMLSGRLLGSMQSSFEFGWNTS